MNRHVYTLYPTRQFIFYTKNINDKGKNMRKKKKNRKKMLRNTTKRYKRQRQTSQFVKLLQT